ncbi:MAG: thioredoxin [Clostridia bacterium]
MLKHIKSENFEEEVLKAEKPILVDFFATWCGPCQMLGPVLEKISNSRVQFDIAKINIDEELYLAQKYNIQVVPTMLIFKNGKIVKQLEGYLTENVIISEMSKYI